MVLNITFHAQIAGLSVLITMTAIYQRSSNYRSLAISGEPLKAPITVATTGTDLLMEYRFCNNTI